ncbi:hypothetical protein L195_g033759 [Trifolium pratense]|uniref:Uncharacterized protein n=1 Tax=Trifolium pratense TaxID=57577 RepID=A0A2K3LGY6_TRIPR|nr:hypothetical protein L195_g033759 [Trifolium pratense]
MCSAQQIANCAEERLRMCGTCYSTARKVRIAGIKESKEVAGRVALMIWLIWNNRNQWPWNQEKRTATQLGVQAFQMWHEWYGVQRFNNNTQFAEQAQQLNQWIPPRRGWLKCNVDDGFHNDGKLQAAYGSSEMAMVSLCLQGHIG